MQLPNLVGKKTIFLENPKLISERKGRCWSTTDGLPYSWKWQLSETFKHECIIKQSYWGKGYTFLVGTSTYRVSCADMTRFQLLYTLGTHVICSRNKIKSWSKVSKIERREETHHFTGMSACNEKIIIKESAVTTKAGSITSSNANGPDPITIKVLTGFRLLAGHRDSSRRSLKRISLTRWTTTQDT